MNVRPFGFELGLIGFVFLTFDFVEITVTPFLFFAYIQFINVKIGFVLQKKYIVRSSSLVARGSYLDAVVAGGRDEDPVVLRRAVGAGVNMEQSSLQATTAFRDKNKIIFLNN